MKQYENVKSSTKRAYENDWKKEMSIDDEIRNKVQSMQAEARMQDYSKRLDDAYRIAGMTKSSPILRTPPSYLQKVIAETMPRMIFSLPKIIRSLPDGTTRVRFANNNQHCRERADDYSFDITVKKQHVEADITHYIDIWFFKNGMVAFCSCYNTIISNTDFDERYITSNEVREKIIEAIARAQFVRQTSDI